MSSNVVEYVQVAREMFLTIATTDFTFSSYDLADEESVANLNSAYSEKVIVSSATKWDSFNKFQVLVAATDIDRLVNIVFAIPEHEGLKNDFLKLVQLARYEVYSGDTVIDSSKDFLEFVEYFDKYLTYLEKLFDVPNAKTWAGFGHKM